MKISIRKQIRDRLTKLAEPEYQKFSSKLLPGTENILGVRLPLLRKEAGKIVKEDWKGYLEELEECDENLFFEEIMLAGMLIGQLKITDKKQKKQSERKLCNPSQKITLENIFSLITDFVPKIDNWSVCDSFCASLKIAKLYPEEMWEFLMPYLKSNKEYFIRFGVVMLLDYYIDEEHMDKVIILIDDIHHEAYYVKMAVAWCLSICYVKFPDKTLEYLKGENHLDDFTYNKTLQKAVESFKVGKTEKEKLRDMKR